MSTKPNKKKETPTFEEVKFLPQYQRQEKQKTQPVIIPPEVSEETNLEGEQPVINPPEVLDHPISEEKAVSEQPLIQQAKILTSKKTLNQQTMDEYNNFVKEHPDSLPDSKVFQEINKLWPTVNKNIDGTDMNPDQKEENKKTSLENLFNINQETLEKINSLNNDPLNTPLPFTISLTNNKDTNLIYYFTKVLFFQNTTPPYNETGIDIKWIKTQLGKDLHRIDIYINKKPINRDMWFLDPGINTNIRLENENANIFNMLLIETANKNKTTINLDLINLFDIASIQQMIQYAVDTIVVGLASYGINQQGGNKTINITINRTTKTVVWKIISRLVNIYDVGDAASLDLVPAWAFLVSELTMNLNELSYSLTSTIKKDISNMRQQAINLVTENPGKAATVLTLAALGATVPLYLPTLLALGGKSKKHLRIKHKNRKTIRKNKHHKTRKTIRKNKRRKTKKYNN